MALDSVDDYLDLPLRALLNDVASEESVPAAGSVIAVLGALAAGLAAKTARRSRSLLPDAEAIASRADDLRASFEPRITGDAIGYRAALAVRGDDRVAAVLPLSAHLTLLVEAAAEIAQLASHLAADGNPNLQYDAESAARIAVTVAEVGSKLIGANGGASELSARAERAVAEVRSAARRESP
jgi:formiminotetrahydrofolate cyclodeaminase